MRAVSCRSPAGDRQDQRDIGAELRLVLFDDPDRIASLLHKGLGHMPLGQQGVQRADPALQDELVQDGFNLRNRIGFVVHRVWGQRQAQVVGQGRQQVDARRALLTRAPQRFAIQRYGGFPRRWGPGCADDAPLGPGAQLCFHGIAGHVPQDRVPRRRTRGVVSQAQRLGDTGPVIAPPFGNGALAAIATQHRTTGQRKHGGQGMAFAPTAAKVRNLGEDLDKGRRLCYHGRPLE